MWTVTVCAEQNGEMKEHTVRVPGNSVEELLDGEVLRWKVLDRLMERGILKRVKIDYKPSLYGVKRIRKIGGLYYLTVDNVVAGKGYVERGDAWASGEKQNDRV